MKNVDKYKIGRKIYEVRGKRSMDEFADLIGVSKSSINSYEKGIMTPRKKVLEKIISLSDNPNQTIEEFLFGSPEEALIEIFKDVSIFRPIKKQGDGNYIFKEEAYPMKWLAEEIKLGSLDVSDITGIFKRAVEIDKNLLNNKEFISSWYKNGIEPIKYEIEKNIEYRTKMLPFIDKEIYKIKDLDAYINLFEQFTKAFLTNENYNEMPYFKSRTSLPDINKIFSKEYLDKFNDFEKDKLKHDFYIKSGSLFKFWDLFNLTFKYDIEKYQIDYFNELNNLEILRKELENHENRYVDLEEIKKKWWDSEL
ncbi:helix-turn-helix domain-containing protein [Macrococcus capreoli]|uniref:helix-turn-helix domain-containing protein n=1 Tax=Macrococcus capreoli TaxID=2982690 RepID=UPI0021D5A0E2|nr:helix-turn-helix transcriptional regulator [Macrococcus sp. TMW 2.2395]MCU7557353.1 helix-turn-helix domain-containing protein [Macrococcus sp. TMW 2.2395]